MAGGRWGLGLVGCGRFGRFVLRSLAALPDVDLVALASRDPENLRAAREAWTRVRPSDPRRYRRWEDLLADPAVDVVAVATPPYTHHPISRAVLAAGKHLFLEKPGGLTPEEIHDLEQAADAAGVRAAVNFVMRSSPVYRWVRRLLSLGTLGPLEEAHLENNAHGDLPPDHWFWSPDRSGGILVEHGVHFFDLMHWLAGPARRVAALALPNARGAHLAPDRVLVTAVHGEEPGGALVAYYHAFTRPAGMGTARWRLTLARGYLTVHGWTPTAVEVDALVTPEIAAALLDLPGAVVLERREEALARTLYEARGWGFRATHRLRLKLVLPVGEEEAYAAAIREGFAALLRAASDDAASPVASLGDAARAVSLARAAEEALRAASPIVPWPVRSPHPPLPPRAAPTD